MQQVDFFFSPASRPRGQRTPLSGQYEPSYRQADASAWEGLYGMPFAEPREGDSDFRLIAREAAASSRLGRVREFSWELASDI